MVPGNPKFDLLPADEKRRILNRHNKAAEKHNRLHLKNEAAKKMKPNKPAAAADEPPADKPDNPAAAADIACA